MGRLTSPGRLAAGGRGQEVADLEMSFLWGAPAPDPIPAAEPKNPLKHLQIPEPRSSDEWTGAVRRVLSHYHCADQSLAGSRFHTTGQGKTAVGPYRGKKHPLPAQISCSPALPRQAYRDISTVALQPVYPGN